MDYRRKCEHLSDFSYLDRLLQTPKAHVQDGRCNDCIYNGYNLWLCLTKGCYYYGCPEISNDHSTMHYLKNPSHKFQLNLSLKSVWCYLCKREFPVDAQYTDGIYTYGDTINMFRAFGVTPNFTGTGVRYNIDFLMESQHDSLKDRMSLGLQNLGNSCYMNAALQALSNTEPLTRFFLECPFVVDALTQGKKTSLARAYKTLIEDIYLGETGRFVVPSNFLTVLRSIFPMFRGTQHHDAQEFLRSTMVHLHDELKYPTVEISSQNKNLYQSNDLSTDNGLGDVYSSDIDSSEAGYETCDSAVNSDTHIGKNRDNYASQFSGSQSSCNSSPILRKRRRLSLNNSGDEETEERQIRYHSIISDIFNGKLLSSVKCLSCNRVSNQMETFQDLSLPIPTVVHTADGDVNITEVAVTQETSWLPWLFSFLSLASAKSWFYPPVVSLSDCLSAFFSVDQLSGDNMYKCDNCKNLRNGCKYHKVLQLPEVLCIHLKRFRLELTSSSKITSCVTFPLEGLDMSPYLNEMSLSKVTKYDLISIICHKGTVGHGHYISYSLCRGEWYEFDDHVVKKVSEEHVQKCEAYILFYRKWQDTAREPREKILHMNNSTRNSMDISKARISKLWFSKFKHCVEPGFINNYDFLCPEGDIQAEKVKILNNLSIEIPLEVYAELRQLYGGCEPSIKLTVCNNNCKPKPLPLDDDDNNDINIRDFPSGYLIAKEWYGKWQAYINKETLIEPGPVDNTHISLDNLDLDSIVGVSKEDWDNLMEKYGGGPDIILEIKTDKNKKGRSIDLSPIKENKREASAAEKAAGDNTTKDQRNNGQSMLNKPNTPRKLGGSSYRRRIRKKRCHSKRNDNGPNAKSDSGPDFERHD